MSIQTSLIDLQVAKEVVKKPEAVPVADSKSYCCFSCIYDPDVDFGKMQVVYRKGRMRVKLKNIAETIYICPKCRTQYLSLDFTSQKMLKKYNRTVRDKRKKRRIEHLKAIYA